MHPRHRACSSLGAALTASRNLGLAFLSLTALTVPATLLAAPAPGFRTLPGHVPAAVANAQTVAPLDKAQPIALALSLPLRNQPELEDLLRGLSNPLDPRFGQFLTPEQFAARFSPTPADYARVIAYAKAMGLTVTGTHANRTLVDVSAAAGQVSRAFGMNLVVYKSRVDGRFFYAPDAEPQVASSVSSLVSGVIGLSNAGYRHPNLVRREPADITEALDPYAQQPFAGTGPGGGLSPSDIKTAYNLNSVSQTGTGQTLGLFELAGYTASDITAYENQFGLTHVPLQNVLVSGYSGAPGSGADEVTLDIELQVALAPSATKILVYEAPNSDAGVVAAYSKIASDNLAKEISTSWGEAENSATASTRNSENTAFKQMAAQGQSIFAASGDSGAYDTGAKSGGVAVDDPASQPYMTGVGGTSLTTVSAGGAYKSEKTWNGGSVSAGAGGGGISTVWAIPSYQSGVVGSTASKGSTTKRNVPDVSLDADPNTGYAIYYAGSWSVFGGTSCAAPLWSAFTALVNQKRVASGSSLLGFANPPIYSLATSGTYGSDFHDIADGSTNLFYPAVTGYDDATGWGTFNGANLLTDLSGGGSTAAATTTSLTSSLNPSTAGQSVTLTAKVTGNNPTGTVQFKNNGAALGSPVTVSGGMAALTTTSLPTGTDSVTAVYSGDTNNLSSTSAALTQTVSAPPASGTTNDTGSGIAYAGSGWSYYPNRGLGDFSDDVHATTVDGDSVSYTFTGTAVSFVTETNADEGAVQVYVDGVLQTTVSCSAGSRQSQQSVYTVSGLTAGSHTIKLVKAGGSYMLLDAFLTTPAQSTTINDTASGLTYTGSGWFYNANRGFGDVSDDVHATTVDGDSVSYTFTGTAVSYLAETYTDEGMVQVYIDGTLQTTVDCSTSTRLSQQSVYTVSGLTSGSHTLKLVKAGGSYMLLDALNIQ